MDFPFFPNDPDASAAPLQDDAEAQDGFVFLADEDAPVVIEAD